jgi:prophage DNA circulation protein
MTNFTDSISSFESGFENFIVETESDVQAVIVKVKQGVTAAEAAIDDALKWIANNTPAIAQDIEEVLSIVTTLGLGANPEVAAAVTAANVAVTALNAFASSENSGATNTAALLSGYTALKQAQSAVASATAAATSVPAVKS